LRAKAHRTQHAPDLRLAKAHTMQAFNDCANTLEGPQFCAESMLGRVLQYGSTNCGQLLFIKLGWTAPLWHRAQCIDVAFIEKTLPCVYGLPRYTRRQRHLRAALACKQQSACLDPLLRGFTQSSSCHDHILQYRYWRHNVRGVQWLS